MQNRVVEVASNGVHLSLSRGFWKLTQEGIEIGRVVIDDIGALIIRGYGASLSINIASRLAAENIPVNLRPNFPPFILRVRRLIFGLMRPVFAIAFVQRIH